MGGEKTAAFSLKESDVSGVIRLIDFHVNNHKTIHNSYTVHVGIKHFDEGEALNFFDNYVIGSVKDKYDRTIEINTEAMVFLYKERGTGAHIVDPYNFSSWRAKRLRWIRPTLERTKEIYEKREKKWSTFLYVSQFEVPYTDDSGVGQIDINHFMVVCRKKSGKPLKFITAYHCQNHQQLLKWIEASQPYTNKKK